MAKRVRHRLDAGDRRERGRGVQGIARADQDAFALRSQERAAAAQRGGRLRQGDRAGVDPAAARASRSPFARDEHPRADTTLEALAKLERPSVKPGGTVTAGNASGVNDGAAPLLIASEAAVKRYGLTPLARVVGAAVAGVPPRIMGIGPVPATQKLLHAPGLTVADLDVIELNEAFAAQAPGGATRSSACRRRRARQPQRRRHRARPSARRLAARGSPLTAAHRTAATAAAAARLATMCIGVGQGIALALERAQ